MDYFYSNSNQIDLWGNMDELIKEKDAINKLHNLYSDRLKTIFQYITDPFVMRNSSNSIMFHFFMMTNNPIAKRIADSVIKPKYKI